MKRLVVAGCAALALCAATSALGESEPIGENLVKNGGFEDSWIKQNSGKYGNNDGAQAKISEWTGVSVRAARTDCNTGYVMKPGFGVGTYLAIFYGYNMSLQQEIEIPTDGEYEFSMQYVHRAETQNVTPHVSLLVSIGDVEIVPAFSVDNLTPLVCKVRCSLAKGKQVLMIKTPALATANNSSVYVDEVSLRLVYPTGDDYLLVDGTPVTGGHPTPGYGCVLNLTADATVEASMPEEISVVDGVTYQCIGWRLFSYDKQNDRWKLRTEGAGRTCSVAYKGRALRLEWVWAHPTSAPCEWVEDGSDSGWRVYSYGENIVQNGGFEDSWINNPDQNNNFGNNNGTQAEIANWTGANARVAKTNGNTGYKMKGGEGVGNYLAILFGYGTSLAQEIDVPADGDYEFSMQYIHRTDEFAGATPRVSLEISIGDAVIVPRFEISNLTPIVLRVRCSLKQGTQTLKILAPTPTEGYSTAYFDEVSLRQVTLVKPTAPCIEMLTSENDDAKGKLHYEFWIPWAGGDETSVDVSLWNRRDTCTDWKRKDLGAQDVGAFVFGTTSVRTGVWHYLAQAANGLGEAYTPDALVTSSRACGLVVAIMGGSSGQPAPAPAVVPPLDPPMHGCLSECHEEKMTHTASPVYMDGRLYTLYQAGETHTVEAVWDPTEHMRMSVVDWTYPPSTPKVCDPGVTGQDFGSFVQTTEQPPCSQTMIEKGKDLYLFFRGRRAEESSKSLWCYRRFDTVRQQLADGAVICTLDGEEFNGTTAANAYNALSGESQTAGGIGDECNIRLFSDGWYYTTPCICGDKVALIVRSQNLTDWESVAPTPNLNKGATMEHDTAELEPGKWVSAWRQENLSCVYWATYDVNAKTWTTPQKVPDSIAVKPYLFRYRGVNYLAANISGTVTTGAYKAVRATLAIFSIGSDGTLTKVKTIANPTGCHYVQTFEDGLGHLYLVYSTDERMLDASQCRSNIAFDLLEL